MVAEAWAGPTLMVRPPAEGRIEFGAKALLSWDTRAVDIWIYTVTAACYGGIALLVTARLTNTRLVAALFLAALPAAALTIASHGGDGPAVGSWGLPGMTGVVIAAAVRSFHGKDRPLVMKRPH